MVVSLKEGGGVGGTAVLTHSVFPVWGEHSEGHHVNATMGLLLLPSHHHIDPSAPVRPAVA